MKRLKSSPIGIAVLVLSMLAGWASSWATGSPLGGLVVLGVAVVVVFVRALRAELHKARARDTANS